MGPSRRLMDGVRASWEIHQLWLFACERCGTGHRLGADKKPIRAHMREIAESGFILRKEVGRKGGKGYYRVVVAPRPVVISYAKKVFRAQRGGMEARRMGSPPEAPPKSTTDSGEMLFVPPEL